MRSGHVVDPEKLMKQVAAELDSPPSPEDNIQKAEQQALRAAQAAVRRQETKEKVDRERLEDEREARETQIELSKQSALRTAEENFHADSYNDAVKQAELQALYSSQTAAIKQEKPKDEPPAKKAPWLE